MRPFFLLARRCICSVQILRNIGQNKRIQSEPFTETAGRETQVENVVKMCGKHVFKASRLVAKDVQGDGLFWSSMQCKETALIRTGRSLKDIIIIS